MILSLAIVAALAAAEAVNPTADELCGLYREAVAAKRFAGDEYAARIRAACELYTKEFLVDPGRPVYNFRPAAPGPGGESSCRVFRSGQPAPRLPDPEGRFEAQILGYDLEAARRNFGITTVVDLRYDPEHRSFAETFGGGVPRLPISPTEAKYRYAVEKALVEKAGMASVYAPTLPEMESFVGNFVPRLEKGPGSKPYVCRLPQGMKDGAKPNWLQEPPATLEEALRIERETGASPMLTSAFEDCRDLRAAFGKERVAAWLSEVHKTSELANAIFVRIAERVRTAAAGGGRVLFHCAGGTDRAGRVGINVELKEYGITRKQIRAYKGPLSDPKIDLIAVDYLLSQRAGRKGEYRYLFPDVRRPERSWLFLGLAEPPKDLRVPALDDWLD